MNFEYKKRFHGIIRDNKLYDYVNDYINIYEEKMDKYDEKINFRIIREKEYIQIMSYDLTVMLYINEKYINGYIYEDKYDKLDNSIIEEFIETLIKNINKNFENIIKEKK
jgi:hypothetical protein